MPREPGAANDDVLGSVMQQLEELPSRVDLSAAEREHRETVLSDIVARLAIDGPRVAQPGSQRGRLFMPFAALKGFEELNEGLEREVAMQED